MKIEKTEFEGLLVVEPIVWQDDRGYFFESFQKDKFAEHGITCTFKQDNEAFSRKGALRGLHYQLPPFAQAKLVRVIQGEVLDVVVDIRPGSKTYGQHFKIVLSAANKLQLFVPHGFAHGYLTISDEAIFVYKCDQYYARDYEGGIKYNDSQLNIDWNSADIEFLISQKDQHLPTLGNHAQWPQV
ncbi:MAG: dTDP-4-dehydrorhamnose 3,5-epimerase [Saprospiraceae bacterium]|nr:dTDP-4-dehydrorhamnose 3,5-epimerase [Saprospiraceae bacterium]